MGSPHLLRKETLVKRLVVLLVVVGALVNVQAALAHDAYRESRPGAADSFWGMIVNLRYTVGVNPTVPNLTTAAMANYIQSCNWTEKKWGNSCAGESFPVWSMAAVGKAPRGLTRINRCHVTSDNPFTPTEAFNALKNRPSAGQIFRLGLWTWMETRSQLIHAHSGFYAGKGKCVSYTAAWLAPLVSGRPIIGSSDPGETYEDSVDS